MATGAAAEPALNGAIGGHMYAANHTPMERRRQAAKAQAGLRAKFAREVDEQWPGLPASEREAKAAHLLAAHMSRAAAASVAARRARARGRSRT